MDIGRLNRDRPGANRLVPKNICGPNEVILLNSIAGGKAVLSIESGSEAQNFLLAKIGAFVEPSGFRFEKIKCQTANKS
jgi:hypothetical protein